MKALPGSIQERLAGRHLAGDVGETMLLVAVGTDGWPHLAMLGVGEVLALSRERLLLALHAGSGTTRGLLKHGRGLLCMYADDRPWRCQLVVTGHVKGLQLHDGLVGVDTTVVSTRPDVVPYANVTGWIHFELTGSPHADTIHRWTRQHQWLREQFT